MKNHTIHRILKIKATEKSDNYNIYISYNN